MACAIKNTESRMRIERSICDTPGTRCVPGGTLLIYLIDEVPGTLEAGLRTSTTSRCRITRERNPYPLRGRSSEPIISRPSKGDTRNENYGSGKISSRYFHP